MDKNTNTKEMVSIPSDELAQLIYDMNHLALMHKNLIRLYEEESRLKKHHKAYLHIRDYADKVCADDKKTVAAIQNRYKVPDCFVPKNVSRAYANNEPKSCANDGCKASDAGDVSAVKAAGESRMQPGEIFALGDMLMDALLSEIEKK